MEQFELKYISKEQVGSIFGNALAQIEAKIVEAHINLLLEPNDIVRQAQYKQLCDHRAMLEANIGVNQPQPEAPTQPDEVIPPANTL